MAHGLWSGLVLLAASGIAVSVGRVCAEVTRRKTLIAILRDAPRGTLVAQKEGPGGPEMWLWVGGTGTGANPGEPIDGERPSRVPPRGGE